jgi:hypothetical protein
MDFNDISTLIDSAIAEKHSAGLDINTVYVSVKSFLILELYYLLQYAKKPNGEFVFYKGYKVVYKPGLSEKYVLIN